MGGAVASWLVRSSTDRAVRVRALAGDTVLSPWARHFTLTVPLSTQEYKWVPAICWRNLTNKAFTLTRSDAGTPLYNLRLDGPLSFKSKKQLHRRQPNPAFPYQSVFFGSHSSHDNILTRAYRQQNFASEGGVNQAMHVDGNSKTICCFQICKDTLLLGNTILF